MALIAHYRLDGSVEDSVGDSHGTSALNYVAGKLGQAADLSLGGTSLPFRLPSTYSIAFWFKAKSGYTGSYRKFAGRGGDRSPGFWMRNTTDRLHLRHRLLDGSNAGADTTTVFTVGEWHHVSFICNASSDGTKFFTYFEGYIDNSLSYSSKPDMSGDALNLLTQDCELDDVRIYDHALSQREVRDLSLGLVFHLDANETSPTDKSSQGVEVVNNGASYVTEAPVGAGSYRFDGVNSSLNTGLYSETDNIFNIKDFSASLWVNLSSHDNTTSRPLVIGRDQGGGYFDIEQENNYIQLRAAGIKTVRFYPDLNEWYHLTAVRDEATESNRLYLNGELLGTVIGTSETIESEVRIGGGHKLGMPGDSSIDGLIADVRIYTTALTADQVKELYQQRASIDSEGSVHTSSSVEASSGGNILDYTTWTVGTTGGEVGFFRNGPTTENYRITDTGPQGTDITVWEARPDSSSNADGGWNSSYYPIDNTKMYRFSVWIRRTVIGNGSYYLGTNGRGSAVLNRSNGSANYNPYFTSGAWGFPADEWVLMVGHVWPAGSGTGDDYPDSGRYTQASGKVSNTNDFVCASGTTSLRHRSYLYYSTDTSTRQQFCYPRIDVVDGSEPSVEDLLYGLDERWESKEFPDGFSVNTQTVFPKKSEVGVTRGLVAWYPLMGDTRDYAGTNDAVNNGAVATAEGYEFDGLDDYLEAEGLMAFGTSDASVSFSMNTRDNSGYKRIVTSTVEEFSSGTFVVRHDSGDFRVGAIKIANPAINQWVHITWTTEQGMQRVYVDGNEVASTTSSRNYYEAVRYFGGYYSDSSSEYYDGTLRDVRIHNVALTPEEVAIQAKLALSNETKTMVTNNCVYTQGQFKEVSS